jgi:hypothetical protein
LVKKLNQEFTLKDLGDLYYFLGIEVERSSKGLLLTQKKYAGDILRHVNMGSCKASSTPMTPSEKPLQDEGDPLGPQDTSQYRNIMGVLQYLALTWPDLSFAVNRVCQFLHKPTMVHWE